MKLKFLPFLFFFIPVLIFAQIKGSVKDSKGNPLPYVNIIVEGTYTGTTTNELGKFELSLQKEQKQGFIIFQNMGYKTQRIPFNTSNNNLEIVLEEENYELQEVTLSAKENPANAIIRQAIKQKKNNLEPYQNFTADFYSRGVFKIKNMPKKILGQEVGDLEGSLDSTGTGIIYLSETLSKISFHEPDRFSETITASKVSGDNKGYSYNTALGSNFNFYKNNLVFMGMNMISPLADNAFVYYKFKLENSFRDDNNFLINTIKVVPRRDNEPVFEGYIYIVEDLWNIYAVNLSTKGYRMANEFTKTLQITQSYIFNKNDHNWAKHLQTIDINAGAFGIDFFGKFYHVFTNYYFNRIFKKNDFTKELIRFEHESNKKTDTFWSVTRPVPLTDEEQNDYNKKDSIRNVRTSKKYLDSIDKVHNKPKLSDLITGYFYNNSFQKWGWGFDGILQSGNFNTVQGWLLTTGFSYFKNKENPYQKTTIHLNLEYGISEEKWRPMLSYSKRFNTTNYATLQINTGWKTQQFNPENPILPLTNTVASLFYKDNYLKIYDKKFGEIHYTTDLYTGVHLKTGLEFSERIPLRNTNFTSWYHKNEVYTSNNPILPEDELTLPFERHRLLHFNLDFYLTFGQKYINRPDGKINVTDKDYPKLKLSYKKGFLSSLSQYNFDFVEIRTDYSKKFGNKGDFVMGVNMGKFLKSSNLAFPDYKHFNGNQSYVSGLGKNNDRFNLLPYYSHSANNAFFELHTEHNFRGYIMNKMPLMNKLRTHLVLGYHQLSLPSQKPYREFTAGLSNVGIGKFRFFKIDYVRAYQGGFQKDGIVVGMIFLDVMNNGN